MRSWKPHRDLGLVFVLWAALHAPALAQNAIGPASTNLGPLTNNRPFYTTTLFHGAAWPQHQKKTETVYDASVVIQVDGDTSMSQSSLPATAILTTSAIVDNAARSALGLDRAKVREGLEVFAASVGPRMTRLEARLLKAPGVEWKEGDAEKLISALADGLRGALDESANSVARTREQATKRWEKEIVEALAKLSQIRSEQKQISDRLRDLPANYQDPRFAAKNATNQLANLDRQIQQQEELLAAKDPASNTLLNEWENLVKLREQKLTQLKTEKRPAAELKDAEIRLAKDRAKLESIRSGVERTSRSSISEIARLKERLRGLHEQRHRLIAVIERIESPETQALFDKEQQLAAAEKSLHSEIAQTRNRTDLSQRQQPIRYIVTVLGGER